MAKMAFTQVKELLECHENTLLKIFGERIDKLEEKIEILKNENISLKKEIIEVNKAMTFQNEKYEQFITESKNSKELKKSHSIVENDKLNEDFKDKIAELEDRSRRNNLRFDGFEEKVEESWKDSEQKVKVFLKEKLGITNNIQIERAHRTGRKHEPGQKKRRTIVVKFLNFKDKETILEEYKRLKLWNERLYINEDYSERTTEKRKLLFSQAKELRAAGKYAKVIYNKLITRT
jgi:hypothetical protein